LVFAADTATDNGRLARSDSTWIFEPSLPRSTGFGPVRAPLFLAGHPLIYFPRRTDPGLRGRMLAEVYGIDNVPEIVRLEPSDDRRAVAVAEGTGLTLLLQSRVDTLRTEGVVYRRFVAPQPCARVGLAYRTPPTQHFLDLAAELHSALEE
jgi:hypothetical protein